MYICTLQGLVTQQSNDALLGVAVPESRVVEHALQTGLVGMAIGHVRCSSLSPNSL